MVTGRDITEHDQKRRIYPQSWPGDAPREFGIAANTVKVKRIVLTAARAVPYMYEIAGSVIWAVAASSLGALATIHLGDEALSSDGIPFQQGMYVRGLRFSRVYVSNLAQPGEWIDFLTAVEGPDQIQIENPGATLLNVVLAKATVLDTAADVVIVAAAAAAIVKAALVTQRAVIITSLAANTQVCRIGDAATAAARGLELGIGDAVTIETTEAIYGWTAAGANQTLTVTWTAD